MKMTWLHKFFGLFFIPANGRAKSAQQLISTVLPFHPLNFLRHKPYFKYQFFELDDYYFRSKRHYFCGNSLWWCGCCFAKTTQSCLLHCRIFSQICISSQNWCWEAEHPYDEICCFIDSSKRGHQRHHLSRCQITIFQAQRRYSRLHFKVYAQVCFREIKF